MTDEEIIRKQGKGVNFGDVQKDVLGQCTEQGFSAP